MAKKPTHYKLTVNRPIEVAGITMKPGARYTVKATVHDQMKQDHPDAVTKADPLVKE
jgi:hypothetical protein